MHILHRQAGQTLVELLVAIGLSAILLPALATAIIASREGRAQEAERSQAAGLLREATEAVRSVREKGWTGFAVNGTYHPSVSGNAWALTAGSETIGNFTRSVLVADAQRNSGGAIVASGGTIDGATKKITVTVSWTNPVTTSLSTDMYFQRYLGNAAWSQTTQADFNGGTKTNVSVTNNSGGEVELAAGGGGGSVDWSSPSIAGSYDASGTTGAKNVFIDAANNRAYLLVSTTLYVVDISNPAVPSLLGSKLIGQTLNSIKVLGNYAYMATSGGTAELAIANISNPAAIPAPTFFDLANSSTAANTIFVDSTYAYIGKAASSTKNANEFFIVNITNPAVPTLTSSLNLASAVNSLKVSGNYAYLGLSGSPEINVVDVTNKAVPTLTSTFDLSGSSAVNDMYAINTTLYVGKANNTSGGEFFILDATNPASVSQTGTYEAGANINGVYVVGTQAFLATSITNAQFRVLNISTPSAPTVVGSANLGSVSNDIAQAGNYAYIASASTTKELTIMQGTVSGGGYQTNGTEESSTFDAGASVAFNYLTFTTTLPASTAITFQLATNNDNATWNYVGPDGTSGTSYSAPGTIRLNTAGRYLRYKATLTGPGTSTPVLSDISINYSP